MRRFLLVLILLMATSASAIDVTITIPAAVTTDFVDACKRISRQYGTKQFTNGVAAGTLSREDCLLKMLSEYMVPEIRDVESRVQRNVGRSAVSSVVTTFESGFAWSPPLAVCGDSEIDANVGESCDNGGSNGSAMPCLPSCSIATCGDATVCSDAACTSGPGGGPEECDPGVSGIASCDVTCAVIP